jgi:hypothetical protein
MRCAWGGWLPLALSGVAGVADATCTCEGSAEFCAFGLECCSDSCNDDIKHSCGFDGQCIVGGYTTSGDLAEVPLASKSDRYLVSLDDGASWTPYGLAFGHHPGKASTSYIDHAPTYTSAGSGAFYVSAGSSVNGAFWRGLDDDKRWKIGKPVEIGTRHWSVDASSRNGVDGPWETCGWDGSSVPLYEPQIREKWDNGQVEGSSGTAKKFKLVLVMDVVVVLGSRPKSTDAFNYDNYATRLHSKLVAACDFAYAEDLHAYALSYMADLKYFDSSYTTVKSTTDIIVRPATMTIDELVVCATRVMDGCSASATSAVKVIEECHVGFGYSETQKKCVACQPGRYSGAVGVILSSTDKCNDECAAGQYSGAAASACKNCPAGYYGIDAPGNGSCTACPRGRFSDLPFRITLEACKECPTGYFGADEALHGCAQCGAGLYSGQRMLIACKECELGKYSADTARTTPCTEECLVGYFAEAGADGCTICPVSKFAADTGSGSCTPCASTCPVGQYRSGCANTGRASDDTHCEGGCAAGFYGQSSGTDGICKEWNGSLTVSPRFCFNVEYVNKTQCTACPVGYHSSKPGTKVCELCPLGFYTAIAGSPQCSACKAGRYGQSGWFVNSSGHCADCSIGQYQNETARTACKVCTNCFAGARADCGGSTQGYCSDCVPGRFFDSDVGVCTKCPNGQYQDQKNLPACKACDSCSKGARLECGGSTHGFCEECFPGQYVTGGVCVRCPLGKYQPESHEPSCNSCGACPAGAREGCSNTSAGYCSDCIPGKYVNRQNGLCSNCPIQYYSSLRNAKQCAECAIGKYQTAEGMTNCLPKRQDSNIVFRKVGGKVVGVEELRCPPVGMDCTGPIPQYTGNVWHDPQIELPNCTVSMQANLSDGSGDDSFESVCTNMYVCPLQGCPDSGTKMVCKEGYSGALCAICSAGHFLRIRECVKCEAPMWGQFALCVVGAVFLIGGLWRTFSTYLTNFAMQKVFARFKIFVSFVTVLVTVETQVREGSKSASVRSLYLYTLACLFPLSDWNPTTSLM